MNTTRRITPHWISSLNENEIFVFGCRRSGRHWEGAALFAHENFGAVFGQGEGRQGQAYAIPTVGWRAADIAPLFVETAKLDNVWLPQEFWDVLDDHSDNL